MNNEENEYFNFIVIGFNENFVIENNEISLWISRFLEYTTDEIKELFNGNYKEIISCLAYILMKAMTQKYILLKLTNLMQKIET